jgi:hypothetical protein
VRSTCNDTDKIRIVYATFDPNGNIERTNEPITITRTAAGSYTVTFIRPFRHVSNVQITIGGSGGSLFGKYSSAIGPTVKQIYIYTYASGSGVLTDCEVYFVATGLDSTPL